MTALTAFAVMNPISGSTDPVVVISAGVGAAHDAAAHEIGRRLRGFGFPVVQHDFLDLLPGGLGGVLREAYARQARPAPASWTWLSRAASGTTSLTVGATVTRTLLATGIHPAAVVSTYPMASQILGYLRRSGRLRAPVAAVLTEPSVHPLCLAIGVDLHLAPGVACAADVRRQSMLPVATVSALVDPAFRPAVSRAEAAAERRRFGLPADERIALIVAGSRGAAGVAATARDVAATGTAVPVVVCGRDDRLRRRLSREADVVTLGWIGAMPALLRAADVVVHDAGGRIGTEAMACGIPIVSYRCPPGLGEANAEILDVAGLSPWPRTTAALAAHLKLACHDPAWVTEQAGRAAAALRGGDAAALIAALVARKAGAVIA
jgi:UDP-N-acetylglucosamine:LPS N-acetylglucosamine transferase